jgi:hypothetical protein
MKTEPSYYGGFTGLPYPINITKFLSYFVKEYLPVSVKRDRRDGGDEKWGR